MIFATVGTQLPFDRLIRAIDDWAGAAPGREVFAQIGPSRFRPRHIEYAQFVSPEECAERTRAATAIVAHAGMGTILTALETGKRLVVMPRRAALGEHRNDHQLATVSRFAELGSVEVALDELELLGKLDDLDRLTVAQPAISRHAPDEFVAAVRAFIIGQPLAPTAHEVGGVRELPPVREPRRRAA